MTETPLTDVQQLAVDAFVKEMTQHIIPDVVRTLQERGEQARRIRRGEW